jgi:hypothetical protein
MYATRLIVLHLPDGCLFRRVVVDKVLDLQMRKNRRLSRNKTYTELLRGGGSDGVVNDKATTAGQRSGENCALLQGPVADLNHSSSYSAAYARRKEQIEHYRHLSESTETVVKNPRQECSEKVSPNQQSESLD